MILEIQHETRLEYTEPVAEWVTELRMEPASDHSQSCHSFHLAISQPAAPFRFLDGFGNRVHHFNIFAPHKWVSMLAASIVETSPRAPDVMTSRATFPLNLDQASFEVLDFLSFRGPVRNTAMLQPLRELLEPRPGQRVGPWLCSTGEYIRSNFEYAKDVTNSASPIDDILEHRKGVCQDFAHLMISVLRSFGVPARYVSGYIHRPEKDSQSHAWLEAWLPDLGWIGFDPTNGCPTNDSFVKVATGRDFTDVPPNKGIFRGPGQESISVRVATRELERLPPLSWHEHLPPLNGPAAQIGELRGRGDLEAAVVQQQQQQAQ
jgi:transglutaminase-like putative cysteine protease